MSNKKTYRKSDVLDKIYIRETLRGAAARRNPRDISAYDAEDAQVLPVAPKLRKVLAC